MVEWKPSPNCGIEPLHHTPTCLAGFAWLTALFILGGCDHRDDVVADTGVRIEFEVVASVRSPDLREISGLETAHGTDVVVHNDDGKAELFVLGANGDVRTRLRLRGARNRDWEDITLLTLSGRQLLAVGDIGDNEGLRPSIGLYFIDWPQVIEGTVAEADVRHRLELAYPDGPRDCEAMAFDPSSRQILLMTKRDKPPRLYGVDVG